MRLTPILLGLWLWGRVHDLNVRLGSLLKLDPKATLLKLQAAVHDFTDDDGSARYGREFDLLAGLPLTLTAEIRHLLRRVWPDFTGRHKIKLQLEATY